MHKADASGQLEAGMAVWCSRWACLGSRHACLGAGREKAMQAAAWAMRASLLAAGLLGRAGPNLACRLCWACFGQMKWALGLGKWAWVQIKWALGPIKMK